MADYVSELIECKMKLAESEDRCNERQRQIRVLSEEIEDLKGSIKVLKQKENECDETIHQLLEEKNKLRLQLEEIARVPLFSKNDTEEDELKSSQELIEHKQKKPANWQYYIDNWNNLGIPAKLKLRYLAKKGIPSDFRGQIWYLKTPNNLHTTESLFNLLLNKATTEDISIDFKGNLAQLLEFQKEQPLYEELKKLMQAYAVYRPDTGYINGMSYLGAILLLNLDTYKAFQCFVNMIFTSDILRVFYSFDSNAIQNYYRVFLRFANKRAPGLLNYLKEMEITPDTYLLEWVYTLFSKCFPLEVVLRIWDSYFFEGDAFIFKVGIAILVYLESKFKSEGATDILNSLNDLTMHIRNPKELFRLVDKIYITENKIKSMIKRLN